MLDDEVPLIVVRQGRRAKRLLMFVVLIERNADNFSRMSNGRRVAGIMMLI